MTPCYDMNKLWRPQATAMKRNGEKKMKIVNVWIEFYNVHSKQCVVKRIIASDKRVHMWYGMC